MWLSKLEAYAILSNANAFLVENVDDAEQRKNGGVALVRSDSYGDFLHQGPGYKHSLEEVQKIVSIEKPAGRLKVYCVLSTTVVYIFQG